MGVYLSEPITKKETRSEKKNNISYVVSSVQGLI